MAQNEFNHLHVHSEYSLLDGANRISDLVEACVKDGQKALALTDHGNMFGAVELYQKCKAAGIKPLIGCEVYIAREGIHQPHHRIHNPYSHLTLLARNEAGLKNLLKLASISYLDGYHFRPRIDREILSSHAEGISCLSGCLSGEVNQLFRSGKAKEAERVAGQLRDLFGPEHFWLELQRNGIEIQSKVNEDLVELSQRTGAPLVGTNDIHYLRQEDCATQDVLLCINTGAKRDDENRFKMDTDSLFFRTTKEMSHLFRDLPAAVHATMEVADQVDVELEFGNYHLPVFRSQDGRSPEEVFEALCEEGIDRIYGPTNEAARERLEHEKKVIREMGFVAYFLIVWDLIKWARDNDISVGPGRGSAAGSIVAYVLDITRVDPLKYGLLFERFLNSERVSMPDIDIDFCKEGRDRVLQYTRDRYGSENVAQIVTFATMASRSVVRDVGRVLDLPLGEVDRLAKMIPQGPTAPPLGVALRKDPKLSQASSDERYTELFDFSQRLDGMARHFSTHAAGVVIADRPIVDYVPLCKHDDVIVTQWPAKQLEELGLLKMDYLGLRTLTILDKAIHNIAHNGGQVPDLEQLPENDEASFELLCQADTMGVFQLESEGMRRLISKLRPDCFEDLIAVLALYRPGPLESGMDEMFTRRKHGLEPIEYPHPVLEPILGDTYGCLVYQEQVMRIANELAGFSLNESDSLRKAMGKKKPEIMNRFSAQFLKGALANGCPEHSAREIWDNMVKFGGYGFNKSHSTAYAAITWRTAYLKTHHRVEFLAANMSCEMQDSDKIQDFVDDCKRSDIRVLPPDITQSEWTFTPEDGAIRYGFGAIKGTGSKAIEALVAGRARLLGKVDALNLHNLCREVDPTQVTRLTWEAVIKAGAFDGSGHSRGAVLHALDSAAIEGARAAEDRRSGQGALFGAPTAGQEENSPSSDGIDDSQAFDRETTLRVEQEVLGFYLTGHPLEDRADLLRLIAGTTTGSLDSRPGSSEVKIGGLIMGVKELTTRKGKKMARFRLEDLEGSVQVTCFPRTFEKMRDKIHEGTIAVCRGRTEEAIEGLQGGGHTLLLDEVMEVDEALARLEGALSINIGPGDKEHLPSLASLFRENPGQHRLFLEVAGDDGRQRRVRAGGQCNIRVSTDLVQKVEGILGKGHVGLLRY